MKQWNGMASIALLGCAGMILAPAIRAIAETCVTQSQMQPAERDLLANAAQSLAIKVQSNDQAGLRNTTIPEFAANFSGIGNAASTTAPKLAGDTPQVDQVYLLDATANKVNPDGSVPGAEFVCVLNKGDL